MYSPELPCMELGLEYGVDDFEWSNRKQSENALDLFCQISFTYSYIHHEWFTVAILIKVNRYKEMNTKKYQQYVVLEDI